VDECLFERSDGGDGPLADEKRAVGGLPGGTLDLNGETENLGEEYGDENTEVRVPFDDVVQLRLR
jgi:hypothetical protein